VLNCSTKNGRGTRSDDGHVAAEDVPELAAHRGRNGAANARWPCPRVVVARPDRSGRILGFHDHRPELVDRECLPIEAHALLLVKGGAGRALLDEPGHQNGGQPADRQHSGRERDIDQALDDAVQAAQRHVVDVDHRQPVEILEPGTQRDELKKVRDDVHVDALAAGELDDAQHLQMLGGGSAT
jgi:hypothetical protein